MQPVWEKTWEEWDESLNSYHGDLASRSQATANQTLQFQASHICPCKIKRLNCVTSVISYLILSVILKFAGSIAKSKLVLYRE